MDLMYSDTRNLNSFAFYVVVELIFPSIRLICLCVSYCYYNCKLFCLRVVTSNLFMFSMCINVKSVSNTRMAFVEHVINEVMLAVDFSNITLSVSMVYLKS